MTPSLADRIEARLRAVPWIKKCGHAVVNDPPCGAFLSTGDCSASVREPNYPAMARAVAEGVEREIEANNADNMEIARGFKAAEARVKKLEQELEDSPTRGKRKTETILNHQARIRAVTGLYADMVNQFAIYFTNSQGVEMVSSGGLSDLEAAFDRFKIPDPCPLTEFRAALTGATGEGRA